MTRKLDLKLAPPLRVQRWFNTEGALNLDGLRGKVVVLHAFQMLCPGCVAHGIPQAVNIREVFPEETVAVIGLHTVFEHHAVMGPDALAVFIHEYRLRFPIAVDLPGVNSDLPQTMQAYGLRGTPSLVLIDRNGYVRLNHFGRLDDLRVGAFIGRLVSESDLDATPASDDTGMRSAGGACTDEACTTP